MAYSAPFPTRLAGMYLYHDRAIIQRGWRTLRQAAKRRTLLFRAMNVCSRSRLQRVRFALHHWRLAAAECRAADARAGAGRAVLVACLAGARRRAMQPAFEAWSELVTRERDEEDDFAGREEGLLVFASALGRVGKRRDRGRKLRALSLWRLGAAQSAVSAAQGQMAVRSEMVTVGARDDVSLSLEGSEIGGVEMPCGSRVGVRVCPSRSLKR